jgi:hypothetical protein
MFSRPPAVPAAPTSPCCCRHCPLCATTPQPRIHLIVDVAETPRQPQQLQPGEVCNYQGAKIVCPEQQPLEAAVQQQQQEAGDRGGGDGLR